MSNFRLFCAAILAVVVAISAGAAPVGGDKIYYHHRWVLGNLPGGGEMLYLEPPAEKVPGAPRCVALIYQGKPTLDCDWEPR